VVAVEVGAESEALAVQGVMAEMDMHELHHGNKMNLRERGDK